MSDIEIISDNDSDFGDVVEEDSSYQSDDEKEIDYDEDEDLKEEVEVSEDEENLEEDFDSKKLVNMPRGDPNDPLYKSYIDYIKETGQKPPWDYIPPPKTQKGRVLTEKLIRTPPEGVDVKDFLIDRILSDTAKITRGDKSKVVLIPLDVKKEMYMELQNLLTPEEQLKYVYLEELFKQPDAKKRKRTQLYDPATGNVEEVLPTKKKTDKIITARKVQTIPNRIRRIHINTECYKLELTKPWLDGYLYTIVKKRDITNSVDLGTQSFIYGSSELGNPYSENWYRTNNVFTQLLCRTDRPPIRDETDITIYNEDDEPITLQIAYVLYGNNIRIHSEEVNNARLEYMRANKMTEDEVIIDLGPREIKSRDPIIQNLTTVAREVVQNFLYNISLVEDENENIQTIYTLRDEVQLTEQQVIDIEENIYEQSVTFAEYFENSAKFLVAFSNESLVQLKKAGETSEIIKLTFKHIFPDVCKNPSLTSLQKENLENYYLEEVKRLRYILAVYFYRRTYGLYKTI